MSKNKDVFLEDLPKKKNGELIDWLKCKGQKVRFVYYEIEGILEIVDVKRENNKTMLGIKYLDNDIYYIWSAGLSQAKLGEIVGINTTKHYYNVGDVLEVTTGRIKIKKQIRKRKNNKWYVFECLECGWEEGEADEYNLKKKQGCGCCTNKVPVTGINTIETTDPWMIPYFINPKDAETHTYGSQYDNLLHCPICGTPRTGMLVSTLYRDKTINCEVCKDGFSYGEKFTYNLLKQLGLKAKRHKDFDWSKKVHSDIPSLCGRKEYDFYIMTDGDTIIETNGLQHYKECWLSRRSYFEESENDKLKEKLALNNKIKEQNYIVIDCRYSTLDFVKNSILNNEKIINKFDLSGIDWLKCEKEALSSYLVKACEYYNLGIGHMEIAKIMDIDFKTVKRYLKRAREFGLCNFKSGQEIHDENFEKVISLWKDGEHNTNEINKQCPYISKDSIGEYLRKAEKEGLIEYSKYIQSSSKKNIKNTEYNKEFISINQASNMSEEVFGIKLQRYGITNSCITGQAYKGLHFQYKENTYGLNQ